MIKMNNKNKQKICKILLIIFPLSLVYLLYFYSLSGGFLIELIKRGDDAYIFFYGYTALVTMLEMTLFIGYYHYEI